MKILRFNLGIRVYHAQVNETFIQIFSCCAYLEFFFVVGWMCLLRWTMEEEGEMNEFSPAVCRKVHVKCTGAGGSHVWGGVNKVCEMGSFGNF